MVYVAALIVLYYLNIIMFSNSFGGVGYVNSVVYDLSNPILKERRIATRMIKFYGGNCFK